MVSSSFHNLVYDFKASSVTTSRVTGEAKLRELSHMDLAMKLHYIKALYFFKCDAVQGIDIYALKEPMFKCLDLYTPVAGRIRRSENGRPFIKCNDGGVRIIEAKCRTSVDEWLGLNDRNVDDYLVKDQVLGPELGFSPLVFLQKLYLGDGVSNTNLKDAIKQADSCKKLGKEFTWFTCGGLSVGLSWAHILGDSFTASSFINTWAHLMSQNQVPRHPIILQNFEKSQKSFSIKPTSLKTIDPIGDTWLIPNTPKMETHIFHINKKVLEKTAKNKTFHFLTALFWKSISKIRDLETKMVTICNKGLEIKGNEIPDNGVVVGIVEADFSIEKVDILDLAKWVEEKMVDETSLIEDYVGKNSGKFDFVLYGANLTFVNLEEVNLYGLELQGKKPVFASLGMAGVGEEGTVLVLPRPEEGDGDGDGRTVTVILPENQMLDLKDVLRKEWGIC